MNMKKRIFNISIIFLAFFIISPAFAGPKKSQNKGYIQNASGEKCWYLQTFEDGVKYFHQNLTQNIGILVFDDPSCMSASEVGLGVNKMMINNIISRWYSHSDAQFQNHENEMFDGSFGQIKGKCIQSKTYPLVGITVDYIVENESIIKVVHGSSAGECK